MTEESCDHSRGNLKDRSEASCFANIYQWCRDFVKSEVLISTLSQTNNYFTIGSYRSFMSIPAGEQWRARLSISKRKQ
jgi:hypothetical protein